MWKRDCVDGGISLGCVMVGCRGGHHVDQVSLVDGDGNQCVGRIVLRVVRRGRERCRSNDGLSTTMDFDEMHADSLMGCSCEFLYSEGKTSDVMHGRKLFSAATDGPTRVVIAWWLVASSGYLLVPQSLRLDPRHGERDGGRGRCRLYK